MSPDGSQSTSRPKATLFCPTCEYEGHAVEGWDVRTDSSAVSHLYCPNCGAHVHSHGLSSVATLSGGFGAETGGHTPADD